MSEKKSGQGQLAALILAGGQGTRMESSIPKVLHHVGGRPMLFYILRIANLGAREALRQDAGLAEGLNTWLGTLTHRGVAEGQHREWTAPAAVIG